MVEHPNGTERDRFGPIARQGPGDDRAGDLETPWADGHEDLTLLGVITEALREQQHTAVAGNRPSDHGFVGGEARCIEQRCREHDRIAPSHAAALLMQPRMYAI